MTAQLTSRKEPAGAQHTPPKSTGTGVPRRDSHELFGTSNRLVIEHGGDEYQLRITRQGKLILTK